MKSTFPYLVLAMTLATQGSIAQAQAAGGPMQIMVATPQQLSITQSASKTVGVSQVSGQSAEMLYGDPTKAGLYTVLLRLEPHKRIMPLSHPDSRFVTVLSGTFYVGFGNTYDETKLNALPAGGIYTEPANANHFGETRDEPALVAITGYGPSGTNYANPADAPK
ncbi:cupin domain-containing protein [Rhizobium sp. LEGMi198b]|uniref:cupin domain-containing protein n=1 Tax=unclassified Rhizobium TaxID=2613769 RepID=UPI000CF2F889|nr:MULTISPECIES: cupin domain-containing protein [Rhizobium]UWU23908.1 cupin domain-containing protein [Rhizobium tropici]